MKFCTVSGPNLTEAGRKLSTNVTSGGLPWGSQVGLRLASRMLLLTGFHHLEQMRRKEQGKA